MITHIGKPPYKPTPLAEPCLSKCYIRVCTVYYHSGRPQASKLHAIIYQFVVVLFTYLPHIAHF